MSVVCACTLALMNTVSLNNRSIYLFNLLSTRGKGGAKRIGLHKGASSKTKKYIHTQADYTTHTNQINSIKKVTLYGTTKSIMICN